jgi:hypothetical protein
MVKNHLFVGRIRILLSSPFDPLGRTVVKYFFILSSWDTADLLPLAACLFFRTVRALLQMNP